MRAPEQPVERGRQHVLAGVLLHVLESALPVDCAVDRSDSGLAIEHVHDVVVSIDDVDDARVAKRPGVERLPAGGRIERGAIEDDGRLAVELLGMDDGGVELDGVGVGVVEALGQRLDPSERRIGSARLAEAAGAEPATVAVSARRARRRRVVAAVGEPVV